MALGPRSVLGHHPPRGPSTTPAPTPQRERQAVQSMNRALLNRVLKGDAEAVEQFGESDHCAVVDWKDDLEAIVVAVSEFVPTGCLRIESPGSDGQRLVHADGKVIESPSAPVRQEELIALVNRALAPQFELRRYRPVDGDGYALFVAPAELWSELERNHPEATERYFLGAERLAAYWRKGFVGRLFSKP